MTATTFAAAAVPIIVLWLLWRLQSLSVDGILRPGMYRLLRRQRATYNVVSWMGVLLHELSHALFLLLGLHGIREFRVRVDGGHVVPHQVRRGPIGTLTFLLAALAPMFVAPALVLLVAWLALDGDLVPNIVAATGWSAMVAVVTEFGRDAPLRVLRVLGGVDVLTLPGALVAGLFIFAMPAARPSYSKQSGKAEGDIAVVRRTIRRNPGPVLGLLLILYAAHWTATWWAGYWAAWYLLWSTALTAILMGALAGLLWLAVAWVGAIRWWAAWLPAAVLIILQWQGRALDAPMWLVNTASLGAAAALAFGLSRVAGRQY